MKNEVIPWKWIMEIVQQINDREVEKMEYKSKLVEVTVYRVKELIRIDLKEVF